MSKVTITLEDAGEGQFRVDTDYGEGGFQVTSHAHQHGMLMLKALNTMAERQGYEGETQVVGGTGEIRETIEQAMASPLPDDLAAAVLAAIQVDAGPVPDDAAVKDSRAIEVAPANSPVLRITEFNG